MHGCNCPSQLWKNGNVIKDHFFHWFKNLFEVWINIRLFVSGTWVVFIWSIIFFSYAFDSGQRHLQPGRSQSPPHITTCHHFGTSTHRPYWIHARAVSCRTGVLVLAGVFLRHVGGAFSRTESILDLLKIVGPARRGFEPGPGGSQDSQASVLPLSHHLPLFGSICSQLCLSWPPVGKVVFPSGK